MFDECLTKGRGDLTHFACFEGVFQRIHQGVRQALNFARFIQPLNDEVLAKRRLLDHWRAENLAVKHHCDAVATALHRLGEGDHLVGARAVEHDRNRIRLLL